MVRFKRGFLFGVFVAGIILGTIVGFSRRLDKQVDKYAEELKEKKKQEERITWRTGKFGPPIYLKETQQGGLKTKP